jgi:Ca2+-binding RTX toxin-like protein
VTLNGGEDADTLLGGSAEELMIGGGGDDAVDGGRGDDVAFLGAGDDTFGWDPGEGSDVVEGQAGEDELAFRGSAGAEEFDLSANGTRARLFRDVGSITMDLAEVETVTTNALGGADTMTVGPIEGTGVSQVETDFAGALGGTSGDGAADRLILTGTAGEDFVEIFGDSPGTAVIGLPAFARSRHTDGQDALEIRSGDEDDRVSASTLPATAPRLTVDSGSGNDTVQTGAGNDVVRGGDGTDFVDPNRGDDTAFLGAGNDSLRWDPGDGSDVAEGGAGTDSMLFLGNAAAERFAVAPNGQRIRFTRDVGAITMDLGGIERLEANGFQGADAFDVEDLSGTGVTQVDMALSGVPASPTNDGQIDRVTVKGTTGDDAMAVKGANGAVTLTGLPARIGIARAEGAFDQLRIEGLEGTDTLDDSGLAPNTIGLAFAQ